MCIKPGIPSLRPGNHPYLRKGLADTLTGTQRVKNTEKRKEKSRDAARSRRGKESEIFTDLARTLPLPSSAVAQLDKASIMRLCVAFLRTRDLINRGLRVFTGDFDKSGKVVSPVVRELEAGADSMLLRALDGFLLVLTRDGDVVYSSENISAFLGISQVDAMGQSLMDYTHPCDHEEVRCFVSPKGSIVRHSFIRMKCTISTKGRNVNLKSATYKVVQMSGQLVQSSRWDEDKGSDRIKKLEAPSNDESWVVALGVPVPHPSNIEIPLDKQTFVSKHTLDMKFTYVDDNVKVFCKYEAETLIGRSIYEMHHALDSERLRNSYKTLLVKGQVETERYRFLALGGGFVWTVTQATLIPGSKDGKPQYVVCLNYVVSEVIQPGLIISDVQLISSGNTDIEPSPVPVPVAVDTKEAKIACSVSNTQKSVDRLTVNTQSPAVPQEPKAVTSKCKTVPVAATSSLLIERTKDMEEGFLTFNNNDICFLKEEPEDLTHLAPSGGDDCVPLDIPPLFHADLEELLKDSIGTFSQDPTVYFTNSSVKDPALGNFDIIETSLEDPPPKEFSNSNPRKPPIQSTERTLQTSGNQGFELPTNRGYKPEQRSCRATSLVPEEGLQSPHSACTGSPAVRFDTPDPPSPPTPLLSQAAEPLIAERKLLQSAAFPSQGPIPATSQLFFSSLDDLSPSSSTMDLFSNYNMKIEDPSFDGDEFDFRAPYIPPMDDMLVLGPEDLFLSAATQDQLSPNVLPPVESENRLEDNDYDEGSILKSDGIFFKKNSPLLRSHSPIQNTKISRSSCVDPNQVLAVQFAVKGEKDESSQELRHLLEEPPSPLPNKESSCSPPPLAAVHLPFTITTKRCHATPLTSPVLKRIRPLTSNLPFHQQKADKSFRCNSTEPRPIFAPVMQHLLCANERPLPASLEALAALPVNRDGKVELTKQQLSTLLGSAGLRYVSVNNGTGRNVHPAPTVVSSVSLAKKIQRADPTYLLVGSELQLPSLQDLSHLDYEVNAPASTPSLLQGADLLTALDQTL